MLADDRKPTLTRLLTAVLSSRRSKTRGWPSFLLPAMPIIFSPRTLSLSGMVADILKEATPSGTVTTTCASGLMTFSFISQRAKPSLLAHNMEGFMEVSSGVFFLQEHSKDAAAARISKTFFMVFYFVSEYKYNKYRPKAQ